MNTDWKNKDLLSIEQLSKQEIQAIFSAASFFKENLSGKKEKLTPLKGKTIVNLFLEPSTRTRVAFEVAAKNLGADIITIEDKASSLSKGESLRDTVLNIQALSADAIVIRHSSAGAASFIGKIAKIPVINAGDGAHEHPTQALLDCFTLIDHFKTNDLKGKKVTILGDILFSRVARSNIWALQKLGAEITLAGPCTLVPKTFKSMGVSISHNLKEALADADAVILLRIQHERQSSTHFPSIGEYTNIFGLNSLRGSWLKPEAVIMHPGPINRGVEIDSDLADSKRSLILNQVTNGIAIRMAALYLCIATTSEVSIH